MKDWIEKFRNHEFAVNCETEEEAKQLMQILYDENYVWAAGGDLLEDTYFDPYRDKTYYIGFSYKTIMYGNKDSRKDILNCPTIKYKQIFKNNKKEQPQEMKLQNIEQIIFNPPATIIKWTDGTKTIVKTSPNDEFNAQTGFLMAYFQKHSGMTKTQVGKYCDKLVEEFNKSQEKKTRLKANKKAVIPQMNIKEINNCNCDYDCCKTISEEITQ